MDWELAKQLLLKRQSSSSTNVKEVAVNHVNSNSKPTDGKQVEQVFKNYPSTLAFDIETLNTYCAECQVTKELTPLIQTKKLFDELYKRTLQEIPNSDPQKIKDLLVSVKGIFLVEYFKREAELTKTHQTDESITEFKNIIGNAKCNQADVAYCCKKFEILVECSKKLHDARLTDYRDILKSFVRSIKILRGSKDIEKLKKLTLLLKRTEDEFSKAYDSKYGYKHNFSYVFYYYAASVGPKSKIKKKRIQLFATPTTENSLSLRVQEIKRRNNEQSTPSLLSSKVISFFISEKEEDPIHRK